MKMKPIILLLTQLIIYIIASVSLACPPPPPPPDCGICGEWDGEKCINTGCMATGCPDICEYCNSTETCECKCAAKITTMGFIGSPTSPACPGDEISFAVGPDSIETCVTWSAPGGHPASQDGGCYFQTHWHSPGYHTVTATTCFHSKQKTVYIGPSCPGVPAGCCLQENTFCCDNEECCDSATQSCCNGSCCDKVWIKKTNTAINESCPTVAECYEGVGCDGTKVTQQQSYDSCENVGVGAGEHCECNYVYKVVGYEYTCQEDWDWSMMASCAFEAVLCFLQCYGAYADPGSCSDCLGNLELDCCGGDTCHMCDFLESCDPTNAKEIKDNVFINFGDCS